MKTLSYRVVMDFPLIGSSVGGTSMRDASVTIVEKVAEIGDESSSSSVMMSMNLVLTATVSVLLAICVKEDDHFEKAVICLGRGGFSEESMVILVLFIYMSGFLFQISLIFIVQ